MIIGGAKISDYERIRHGLRHDDFCICCDSGLKHSEQLRIRPSLIIGDFDSHDRPDTDTETIVLPREKDDTDTVFAAREALLLYLDSIGKKAQIADDYSVMEMVSRQPAEIDGSFAFFSLLNISGTARDITIRGAKYPLEHAEIRSDYQYGISNEVLPGGKATVSVGDGKLLLVKVF